MHGSRCESVIEFAMEARGFRFVFTCSLGGSHQGRHHSQNVQRQRASGVLKPYRMEWTDMPVTDEMMTRGHSAKNSRRFRYPQSAA